MREAYSERKGRIVNRMIACLHYLNFSFSFWRVLGLLCFSPAHGKRTLDLD